MSSILKIVVTVGLLLLLVEIGSAATFTVNASGGADYTRIQDAVNASNNGDTIMVAAGIYNENVVVNKSVNLIGAGADITIVQAANSNNHVFNVTVNSVNITGFTLTGATANQNAGIYLKYSNNNELTGNNVSNNEYGFYLDYSDNNNLTGNNVSDNNNPISLYYSNNNNLTGNNVSKNNWGIYIGSSSNNNIKENNILNNTNEGIYLSSSSNNNLTGNNILNCFYGITLYYSNNNNLTGNNASNEGYGIYLYRSNNNNLTGNNVSNNSQPGISIAYSSNNTIYNNYFNNVNNGWADGNNIWNITKTAGTNIIGGLSLGGNFWANPGGTGFSQTCVDADRDGICDASYTLTSLNIDYLPLAAPDTRPPVIQIMSPQNTIYTTINIPLNVSANEAISAWLYSLNGAPNVTFTPNTTITAPEGSNKVIVLANDTAGNWNSSTVSFSVDSIAPASIFDLKNISYAPNYINWTWTDPQDPDFSKVMIYLNGSFQTNVTNDTQYYNATGLTPNMMYEISTRTIDIAGNINNTWVNRSTTTAPDTTVPDIVTNLKNITYASTYINWTWTDPSDPDFAKVKVYLDGIYKNDVLKGVQYYNATDLAPGTYTIGTRTMDTNGNINATMVTNTSTTILPTIRFINGTVMDSITKEVLSGVTVSTIGTSATSNTTGFYSLPVASGTYPITATYDIRYYTNNSVTISTASSAVVLQDIELLKKPTGNISGSVTIA